MKVAVYPYSGSYNHGCEALIRSIKKLLGNDIELHLYSKNIDEDLEYGVNQLCTLHCRHVDLKHDSELFNYVEMVCNGGGEPPYYGEFFYNYYETDYDLAICTGGDEYCYPGQAEKLAWLNKHYRQCGVPTFLWGCSIEPILLRDPKIIEDLKRYSWITARETITYDALKKAGIENVSLSADPAFVLEMDNVEFPRHIRKKNLIGINISPLIISKEAFPGIVMQNFIKLIQYILENTDYNIILIPHVVWCDNDDRAPLKMLYEFFKKSKRIYLVEDCSCTKLKGYISKLKLLICARTHASIAAYSNKIPTLVVGYSVKSRGIAQDLFGYTQDYVIPVEELQDNSDLLNKFLWMLKNEKNIKDKLIKKIPEYVRSTGISSEIARDLLLEHEKKMKAPILLNDKKKCCGCLACVNICSYNAINIVTDKEGFKYPQINSEVCVSCGKCSEVCPGVTPRAYNKDLPELKGAYAKNIKIREISSSGGIFYLLGKYFLERKGVVFGAAWNGDNKLVHQRITEISKLDKLCGSKYVQSDMGNTYQYVKNDLEKGKMVYFSGTPCQVKALKLFLGQSYEKLLTQDFICHGVPSPEVLQKYTDEVLDGACVNQILFRSKKRGWSNYSFEIIGREHMYHCVFNEDPFFHAFLRDYSLRPSCYECPSKGIFRHSDITLADYWGVETIQKKIFDDKGTSLIFLNSDSGRLIFEEIKGDVIYENAPIVKSLACNPSAWKSPVLKKEHFIFFENYKKIKIKNLIEIIEEGKMPCDFVEFD